MISFWISLLLPKIYGIAATIWPTRPHCHPSPLKRPPQPRRIVRAVRLGERGNDQSHNTSPSL
jgi:hypothetical protein